MSRRLTIPLWATLLVLVAAYSTWLLTQPRRVEWAMAVVAAVAPVAVLASLAAPPRTSVRRWSTAVAWPLLVGLVGTVDALATRAGFDDAAVALFLVIASPVAIATFAVLRVGAFDRRALVRPGARWAAGVAWTVLAAVVLALVVVMGTNRLDPVDALVLLLIFTGPAILVGILTVILRSDAAIRRRRAAVVLSYLEQAVRLNLPLPPFLAAAAASEPSLTARRLTELRQTLERGTSVAAAVTATVPEVTPRDASLLLAGERAGRVPAALDRLVNRDRRLGTATGSADEVYLAAYPPTVAATVTLVVTLLCVFVLPKYLQILHDFRTPVPWATQGLIWVSNLSPVLWLVLPPTAIAAWIGLRLFRRAGHLVGPAGRARDLSDACRVMADAVESGQPLDRAVGEGASVRVNGTLRVRLSRWADGLTAGQPPADAARTAGLPPLVAGLVATAGGAAAADALRFLARHYALRHRQLAGTARALAVPAVTFALGAVVAFVALALSLPLVNMIDAASYSYGGHR